MFINNNLNKGISMPIAILVIIAVAVVAGGLVLWQYSEMEKETADVSEAEDTEIDTSDWKTYRNEEYGFEIQYPEGTKITDIDAESGYFFMQIPFSENGTKLSGKTLRMRVVATEFHYGVEIPASCISDDNIGSIVVNEITFIKSDVSSEFAGMEGAAIATEYCVMKANLAFKLIFTLGYRRHSQLADFDQEKESIIFNQMLSTFRFVEQF